MTKELFRQAAEDIVLPKFDITEIKGVTQLNSPECQ